MAVSRRPAAVVLGLVGAVLLVAVLATAMLRTSPAGTEGRSGAAGRPVLHDPHPCRTVGFTCSTVRVPLDHGDPGGRQLDLQVAAADTVRAPRGVLVFLTGGPGQPGVEFLKRTAAALSQVLDDYRLVMVDQRGTGRNALACPALQRQLGETDLYVPSTAAVRDCAEAIGPDRRFYGTADTVADLDIVRRALGVNSWALDGVSYGTFVAAHYAIAHPAHTSRLVLDSVVPHAGLEPFLVAPLRATGRVLTAVCRQRPCPGDPAADLTATLQGRDDGSDVLNALTVWGIVSPAYRDVPEMLHAAAAGDSGRLDGLVRGVLTGTQVPVAEFSQGLHAATLCADGRFPWSGGSTPYADKLAAVRRAATGLTDGELAPFDRRTALRNGILVTCERWPPTDYAPLPRPRLLPDVPTLLLGGDRDLSTPVEWLREEAAVTPDATVVVVPGAGHSVQIRARDDAGRDAVARFLAGR